MATFTGADRAIGFLFDMVANIASDYDSTTTYAQGAYAIYSGTLYKCISAIIIPEDFTPAHWQAVLVMDEVAAGGGGGGGTTVIANPAGAATDTLNKLQVDQTIYSIPSGGGGSAPTLYSMDDIVESWGNGFGQVSNYWVRQFRGAFPAMIKFDNIAFLRLAWSRTGSTVNSPVDICTFNQTISNLMLSSTTFMVNTGTTHYASYLPQVWNVDSNSEFAGYTLNTSTRRLWFLVDNGKVKMQLNNGSSPSGSCYELQTWLRF